MKVYAVIAGIDYEGEVFDTLRLFDCLSAAEAYKADLEAQYDYALMETREVCMESLIGAGVLNTKDGITTPW
jgi:cephalosporin-C deacetylase-like acetyl esterase